MYLIVNSSGTRHTIFSTFQQLVKSLKFHKNGQSVYVTILKPGDASVYDLVLTYARDTVSQKEYIRGFIINNPTNLTYKDIPKVGSEPVNTFLQLMPLFYEGKRYNISNLFPNDVLVNNHLPIITDKEVPYSLLDSIEGLIPVLDTFFNIIE